MKVKCINTEYGVGLIKGKIYDIIREDTGCYYIKVYSDCSDYFKHSFEIVED